jgi:hypothetical protein
LDQIVKRLACAVLLILSLPATAFAQEAECKASFALVKGTGQFTALTLFNFGQHFELQADTPAQQPLDKIILAIDGEPVTVHPSMGLDDMLVGFSTDPAELQVSDEVLDRLSAGSNVTVTADTGGVAARSEFSLKGSAAAIRRVKGGCK